MYSRFEIDQTILVSFLMSLFFPAACFVCTVQVNIVNLNVSTSVYLTFPCCFAVLCFQMARHSHTVVEWMGNMVIFGGELANGSLANDVWMYRPLHDDWQQLGFSNSPGAPKLANHAAAVVDNYLYVFGGGFCMILSP